MPPKPKAKKEPKPKVKKVKVIEMVDAVVHGRRTLPKFHTEGDERLMNEKVKQATYNQAMAHINSALTQAKKVEKDLKKKVVDIEGLKDNLMRLNKSVDDKYKMVINRKEVVDNDASLYSPDFAFLFEKPKVEEPKKEDKPKKKGGRKKKEPKKEKSIDEQIAEYQEKLDRVNKDISTLPIRNYREKNPRSERRIYNERNSYQYALEHLNNIKKWGPDYLRPK